MEYPTTEFYLYSAQRIHIPFCISVIILEQCITKFGNGYFGTTAVTTNSGNGYAGAEGSSKFNYTVPTGYSALSTKGLNE